MELPYKTTKIWMSETAAEIHFSKIISNSVHLLLTYFFEVLYLHFAGLIVNNIFITLEKISEALCFCSFFNQ